MAAIGGLLANFNEEEPKAPWFSNIGSQVSYGSGGSPMGGGGANGFSAPPELAQYFDAVGNPRIDDPRQVASEAGIGLAQLAGGLLPRGMPRAYSYEPPNDLGGFFRIQDLFGLSGRPSTIRAPMGDSPHPAREGGVGVPSIAQMGQEQPSTNNWRLLGQGPGWIMRNGYMINTRAPEVGAGFWQGANLGGTSGENWPLGISRLAAVGGGYPFGYPSYDELSGQAGWPGATHWPKVWQNPA